MRRRCREGGGGGGREGECRAIYQARVDGKANNLTQVHMLVCTDMKLELHVTHLRTW